MIRVAAAQYPIDLLGGFDAFRAKLSRWFTDARGAQLLVFPEYGGMELASLFPADIHRDLKRQLGALQDVAVEVLELYRRLARMHGVHVLSASMPIRVDGGFRNRAWLIDPEGKAAFQDKLVMTRFENEQWGISPGDEAKVFETVLGRIGVSICYDIEFPAIAHAQAASGADLILAPSCTDTRAGASRVKIGAQARALENQCAVIVAPTVGVAPWSPAVDVNVGQAAAFAPPDYGLPDSGVLAEGVDDMPGWVFADIDLDALARVRREGQVFNARDWDRGASFTKPAAPSRLT